MILHKAGQYCVFIVLFYGALHGLEFSLEPSEVTNTCSATSKLIWWVSFSNIKSKKKKSNYLSKAEIP